MHCTHDARAVNTLLVCVLVRDMLKMLITVLNSFITECTADLFSQYYDDTLHKELALGENHHIHTFY